MIRLAPSVALAVASTIACQPGARPPAAGAADGEREMEPSAACTEPARLVDAARASALWVIEAPSASPGAQSSRLAGQFYSSGGLHVVLLDTLDAHGCWRTADSVATPVASASEFVTNACGPAPDSVDRGWVAVLPDTTAQVPRVAWRLRRAPPRIVPASTDSVQCWRNFTG